MKEEWRDIPIIEGRRNKYQVSNKGRIRSIQHIQGIPARIKILKTSICKGFEQISLQNKKEHRRSYSVSRIVAQAFSPIVDESNMYVSHIDGNNLNNNADNLEWKSITEKHVSKHIPWISKEKFKPVAGEIVLGFKKQAFIPDLLKVLDENRLEPLDLSWSKYKISDFDYYAVITYPTIEEE